MSNCHETSIFPVTTAEIKAERRSFSSSMAWVDLLIRVSIQLFFQLLTYTIFLIGGIIQKLL